MGRTSKWFRSLLSSKKSPASSSASSPAASEKEKKKSKWALLKSADVNKFKNGDTLGSPYVDELDANKHAIAVAAATAAVAEAALAAAQAAAEVVRLTSGGGSGRNVPAYISGERQRVAAAIKIQSAFRAYLARRALRALKGLVKLQALVRGHIVRKQSTDMLRRMQAMARIQARASASRSYVSESSYTNINFSNSRHPGAVNSRNYSQRLDNTKQGGSTFKQMLQYNSRSRNSINKQSSHLPSNWLDHWMDQCTLNNLHNTSLDPHHVDDDRSDKILEIDTWKPRQTTRRNEKTFQISQPEYSSTGSISRLSSKLQKPNPSVSSEVSSVRSPNLQPDGDEIAVWMAGNSSKVHSASSRRGPFVPITSDCSRSLLGDYISHPSYMANTESSRAKVRSQSAPKQRMQSEELGISSSFGHGLWELEASSEKGFALPGNYRSDVCLNSLPGNYRSNVCLNSHLKRQGTPARGVSNIFSSTYGYRF